MPRNKAAVAIGLIGCWIVMSVLGACQQPPAAETPPPSTVASLFATDSVSATGKVLPSRRATLSFAMSGRVKELLVSEGDAIRAGELLAMLDMPELAAGMQQAEAALEVARAELERLGAPVRVEQIQVSEAAVALAQEGAKASEIAVLSAQAGVAGAEAARKSALATLTRLMAGALPEELELARQGVERAKALLYSAQGQRDAVGGQRNKAGYQGGSWEAAEGQVMAAETGVTVAELSYRLLRDGARAEDVAAAQAAVDQAEASLRAARVLVDSARQQVAINQAQVLQAQAQLDLVAVPAREVDLLAARARVVQAEAGVASALAALEKAELRSPIDGTVAELGVRIGEYVMMGTPVMSVGDLSTFLVETTDLDEIDIARVDVGSRVSLEFDALPGVRLDGTVQKIAQKASAGGGGTAYTTTIAFQERDERLRWGMTAFADIIAR